MEHYIRYRIAGLKSGALEGMKNGGGKFLVPGHFAERHFAERHFAERHFAERTFCRTDILPNGQFAERTTCRK